MSNQLNTLNILARDQVSVVVSTSVLRLNGGADWLGVDPLADRDRIYMVANNGISDAVSIMVMQKDVAMPSAANVNERYLVRIPAGSTKEVLLKAGEVAYIVRVAVSTRNCTLKVYEW
jgi:hypothetical protein